MKTTILLLCSFLLLISCEANKEKEDLQSNKFTSKSVKIDLDTNLYETPISLDGNIKVWSNKNEEVVAYTETETHIHIFILQKSSQELDINNKCDKIIFLDHSMALVNKDSKELLLVGVKDKTQSIDASRELRKLLPENEINEIEGEGVVHIWLNKNNDKINTNIINLENLLNADSVFKVIDGGFGGGEGTVSCDSGGPGSTSCSVKGANNSAGCSVSCSAGFYSCCDESGFLRASCKCYPNK